MFWINAFKMSPNKLFDVTNNLSQQIQLFIITITTLQCISQIHAQVPAVHLLPPPPVGGIATALPIPQALIHSRPQDYSKRFEAQPIPLQQDSTLDYTHGEQNGLMTRLARWFGFAGGPQEQQLAASTFKHAAYSYPKPNEQLTYNGNKAPCNLCNKYPWIPMMPLSVQYPPNQQQYQAYQQHQWQQHQQHQQQQQQQQKQPQAQASKQSPAFASISQFHQTQQTQQSPIKQRAVHFNFPIPYTGDNTKLQGKTSQYTGAASSPPPNGLNANALPTVFNAKPFHSTTSTFVPFTEQQLPTTKPAKFAENIGASSVLQPNHVQPTQIPPSVNFNTNYNSNVEIIKSHQLTDFVSSVEYPATFVNSPSIDLGFQPNSPTLPENHRPEAEISINTAKYSNDLLPSKINNHIPASQLLTEPGSLSLKGRKPIQNTNPPNQNSYAPVNHKEEVPNYNFDADNSPAASTHNKHNSFHLQSNDIFTTTETPIETTTIQTDYYTITGKPQKSFEFVPSLQVASGHTKERATPKRLLDAPIQHAVTARPFTRDPSELDYRLGGRLNTQQQHQQQQQYLVQHTHHTNTVSAAPWLPTVTPPPPFSVSSAIPTPTSTYGAIDASGQYAGMSPPAAKPAVKQIIVPYTTKTQPRPFEPPPNAIDSTANSNAYDKWHVPQLPPGIDPHEQQESKVVISTATEVPSAVLPTTIRPPTTKYVTKVLAANLRELLRREQILKNRTNPATGVDLRKLQENIDDWTEQEYTSLSHRPSTPTIRGRSKHIPAEYLTTTTTPAPFTNLFKTTRIFDSTALSTSINNLESLKPATGAAGERGSKRFQYPPIEENFIGDFERERVVTKATTTPTTTTTTTTTDGTVASWPTISHDRYTTPIYMRPLPTQPPPEVLWQKAKVLISPDTKEKLYVVTPQPRYFPQRLITTTTEKPIPKGNSHEQKTPRFLVRPTPGNGSSNITRSVLYSPSPFGLPGLSAYVPAEPVEIIDGNSKVVTIVTPSTAPITESNNDLIENIGRSTRTNYVTIKRNHFKPTMSPSPR